MHERAGCVSSDLQAAQERLAQIRRQFNILVAVERETAVSLPPSHASIPPLPSHLSWHSQAVYDSIKSKIQSNVDVGGQDTPIGTVFEACQNLTPLASAEKTIVLYPDIAMSLLKHELAATGRIWLLLRFLDDAGRGWVSIDNARDRLTRPDADLRVCGKRQLRNLLAEGEGVFWARRNGRLWLRSLTKVAAALDIDRLRANPVALPVSVLTKKIGTVRAHLYATFHSSRNQAGLSHSKPQPIARITLQKITHVHPRIQQRYDKIARVKSHRNFGVGDVATEQAAQEAAWKHGQTLFQLSDKEGKQGKSGEQFLAWQLPNSYVGPHKVASGNQRKRVNKKLTDLLHQGTVGNGQFENTDAGLLDVVSERRYCENGRFAAQAYNKNRLADIYWVNRQPSRSQAHFWHYLSE